MKDTIVIDGTVYTKAARDSIEVDSIKIDILNAVGCIEYLLQQARELHTDMASKGLTVNSIETEGHLRGLITAPEYSKDTRSDHLPNDGTE